MRGGGVFGVVGGERPGVAGEVPVGKVSLIDGRVDGLIGRGCGRQVLLLKVEGRISGRGGVGMAEGGALG